MTTPVLERGLDQLGDLLDQIAPDDLGRPTPCSEWTVAQLADHVVNSTAGMVAMASGGQPDWESAPHHDDPADAYRTQAATLLDVTARADSAFPAGMACAELALHAFDLAVALGRGVDDLDDEVADSGLAFMRGALTEDQRAGAFGPEQPAPDDAGSYQRIAAFSGRTV